MKKSNLAIPVGLNGNPSITSVSASDAKSAVSARSTGAKRNGAYRGKDRKASHVLEPFAFEDVGDEYWINYSGEVKFSFPAVEIVCKCAEEESLVSATVDYMVSTFDGKGRWLDTFTPGKRAPYNAGLTVTKPIPTSSSTVFTIRFPELKASKRVQYLMIHSEVIIAEQSAGGLDHANGVRSAFHLQPASNGASAPPPATGAAGKLPEVGHRSPAAPAVPTTLASGFTQLPTGHHAHMILRLEDPCCVAQQIWLSLSEVRRKRLEEMEAAIKKVTHGWTPRPGKKTGGLIPKSDAAGRRGSDASRKSIGFDGDLSRGSMSVGSIQLEGHSDCDTQSSDSDDARFRYIPPPPAITVSAGSNTKLQRPPRPRVVREKQLTYNTGRSAGKKPRRSHHNSITASPDEIEDESSNDDEDDSSQDGDLAMKLPLYNSSVMVRYDNHCYNLGSSKKKLKQHAAQHRAQYIAEPEALNVSPQSNLDEMVEEHNTPTPPPTPPPGSMLLAASYRRTSGASVVSGVDLPRMGQDPNDQTRFRRTSRRPGSDRGGGMNHVHPDGIDAEPGDDRFPHLLQDQDGREMPPFMGQHTPGSPDTTALRQVHGHGASRHGNGVRSPNPPGLFTPQTGAGLRPASSTSAVSWGSGGLVPKLPATRNGGAPPVARALLPNAIMPNGANGTYAYGTPEA